MWIFLPHLGLSKVRSDRIRMTALDFRIRIAFFAKNRVHFFAAML
jgi:hypothetical protein